MFMCLFGDITPLNVYCGSTVDDNASRASEGTLSSIRLSLSSHYPLTLHSHPCLSCLLLYFKFLIAKFHCFISLLLFPVLIIFFSLLSTLYLLFSLLRSQLLSCFLSKNIPSLISQLLPLFLVSSHLIIHLSFS